MEKKKKKKEIKYSEADLIVDFQLTRLVGNDQHPLMQAWTTVEAPALTSMEENLFDMILNDVKKGIEGWNEEELKFNFIAFVMRLGHLTNNGRYKTFCEREIFATVEDKYLYLKSDFMIAKGVLDKHQTPYFYMQEYKKLKDPSGDPVPQLLEGFLIAMHENKNGKPMYGCTVTGKLWDFFVMEGRTYCISDSYDCRDKNDLLLIISILRKYKDILETTLLDD
jgi:hypothetical protein